MSFIWRPSSPVVVPRRERSVPGEEGAEELRVAQQMDVLEEVLPDVGVRRLSQPGRLGPVVEEAAGGRGIGAGLLRQARDWAIRNGLHRLELTVMAHNHRAADLYQRMGYSVEGRRAQCLLVDGRFVDELYMAALLPDE